MSVAIYCIAMGRPDLLRKSLQSLKKMAGMPFSLYVWDQATDHEVTRILNKLKDAGQIKWYENRGRNVGQHIAANFLLDRICSMEPQVDYIMRWDPDAMARSRRFLKKMVKFERAFQEQQKGRAIVSPWIDHLEHPPPTLMDCDEVKVDGKCVRMQVVEILGGICRLHPAWFFDGWRFNQFLPMGMGEAGAVADRVTDMVKKGWKIATIRLPELVVDHTYGEAGQKERWPEEFDFDREMRRKVSYGL